MRLRRLQLATSLLAAAVCLAATPVSATLLGAADSFAVLGASTVTSTGATAIQGDLGVYPGTAITGLDQIALVGAVHQGDSAAQRARADVRAAYDFLATQPFTANLSGKDLGGRTLTPGIYHFDASAQLTGVLNLDALNDPNALFVFQIGSALTTASSSVINMSGGGAGNSVFFTVGSSATLGTGTVFAGNILADQSITLNTTAAILCGRALALNAAVTLDTNAVSNDCAAFNGNTSRTDYGSGGFSGRAVRDLPEPATATMVCLGLFGMAALRKRQSARQASR